MKLRKKKGSFLKALIVSVLVHLLLLFLVVKPPHLREQPRRPLTVSLMETRIPEPSPPISTVEPQPVKPAEKDTPKVIEQLKQKEPLKPESQKPVQKPQKPESLKPPKEEQKQLTTKPEPPRPVEEVDPEQQRLEAIKEIEKRIKERQIEAKPPQEPKGAAFELYLSQLQERIRSFWVIPEGLLREDVKAIIRVRIDPQGRLLSAELERSSGDKVFDRSALQAVKKAEPFPPPPGGQTMEVGLVFRP